MRTQELISPLQRTLALRQGIHSLPDYRTENMTFMNIINEFNELTPQDKC
ncbi:hypothetical protein QUA00_18500 [Microcoleus sp. T2B6]